MAISFNPYAKKVWNDRYYDAAKARRNWQIVAALFALLACSSSGAVWYVLQREQLHVIVAQIDSTGRRLATYEVTPSTISVPKAHVIGQELATYIEAIRSVSPDYWKKRDEYDQVKVHLVGEALGVVNGYFDSNPPHEIMKSAIVNVNVTTVRPEAGKSWTVRWTEKRRDKTSGEVFNTTTWEATMQVELQAPTLETVLVNPFGIYVTGLTWSEVKELNP